MKTVAFPGSDSGSPNSPAWHSWRQAGIGGSDTIALAAAHRIISPPAWAKSLHGLWEEKTGRGKPTVVNAAMRRGTEGEGPARAAYEAETGIPVCPAFGEAEFWPICRASLDGITFGGDLLTEIKCPSPKIHALAKAGKVVEYYQPQLAHQAMVAWGHPQGWNGQEIHFWSFVPETGDGALVSVKVSTLGTMAEQLLAAEQAFWALVEADTAPCGDEFASVAGLFLAADVEFELAKAEKERLRLRLIELAGNVPRIEGGGVVVSRKVGTLDAAAAAAAASLDQVFLDTFRPVNWSGAVEAALTANLFTPAFLDPFRGDVDYAAAVATAKVDEAILAKHRADDGGYIVTVAGKKAGKKGGAS